MDDKEIPVIAGIGQTFHNCTFLIHVGKREEFTELILDLVHTGVITPTVGEKLQGEEDDRKSK